MQEFVWYLGGTGAHIEEHDVSGGVLELVPPEDAIVQGHGRIVRHQLQQLQTTTQQNKAKISQLTVGRVMHANKKKKTDFFEKNFNFRASKKKYTLLNLTKTYDWWFFDETIPI